MKMLSSYKMCGGVFFKIAILFILYIIFTLYNLYQFILMLVVLHYRNNLMLFHNQSVVNLNQNIVGCYIGIGSNSLVLQL